MFDEKFWIAVAFFIFIFLAYKKLAKIFLDNLDNKTREIEQQLSEATKLQKEAKKIKEAYLAKQTQVELEAKAIINQAEKSAEQLINEAQQKIEKNTEQRIAQAEEHILNMEKQALDELKINAIKEAINLFKVNLDKNIDQESIIKKSINSLKQTA